MSTEINNKKTNTKTSTTENLSCHNCCQIKVPTQFDCYVCQRKMIYHHCNICDEIKDMIDVCSPKCRQILNGGAHIIPIQYQHKTVLMIEDFDDLMGLKVVNHPLLHHILTDNQKEKMNKKCKDCKEDNYKLLPYKCWVCKDTYTYEVECPHCYNKNGYICDECDFEING